MTEEQPLLSLEAAANVLKVGVPTIESLINRGQLAVEPNTNPPQISYAALVDFLRTDQQTLMDAGQPADRGMIPPDDPAAP